MRAEAPIGAGMESTNDARTGCEAGREQARSATLAHELQRLVLTYAHSLSSAHAAPFLPEQCLFPTGGWAEGCSPFQRFLCGVRGKRVKEGQES